MKNYQLFCNQCSYKKIIESNEDIQCFVEIKRSSLTTGSPYYDPLEKKTVKPEGKKRKRLFKCPRCGFVLKLIETENKGVK